MPEDDGRMICDNPTSYQLLKAKHGFKRATPHIKNFLAALLEHPTNFIVGIGIILRFIFTTALDFVVCLVASFIFIPTMYRRTEELNKEGKDNTLRNVCGGISVVVCLLFLFLILIVSSDYGVSIAPHHVKVMYAAFLTLLTTNALSGISELGRYARNKKAESASAVIVPTPVNVVARESSDMPSVPVASPAVTSYNAQNVIDCDSTPFIPDGWSVKPEDQIDSRIRGKLVWDSKNISFYLNEQQKTNWIQGHDLHKKLAGWPVLPANVLDYLFANPHLIPKEWKGKFIYFWGTIYRNSDCNLYVGCLCWDEDCWCWYYDWLDNDWDSNDPAAVPASLPAEGR